MNAIQIVGVAVGVAAVATGVLATFEWLTRERLRQRWSVDSKTCFLVSDKQWQSVLGLIPVAYRSRPVLGCWCLSFLLWLFLRVFCIWLPIHTLIRKNPVLIFHEEDDGAFDADSVIYFLQQFSPDLLYVAGDTPAELDTLLVAASPLGAGLTEDRIFRIYPGDYSGFWSSIGSVVLVDRVDYRSALMGAVYASLKSIPIFFANGANLDDHRSYIDGKRVYVVGDLETAVSDYVDAHASSRRNYTRTSLIDRYISRTRTRKIILVNPGDLDISIAASYQPDKSGDEISVLFAKGSLPAPILAAGRHEVILFPSGEEPAYDDFDQLVEEYVGEKKVRAKYLTIIGCPSAIPQSIPADPPTGWNHRLELDGRYYGSVQQDLGHVDLATGRIYGISPSDASGNIARSLFYSHLPRNRDALVLPREDHQSGIADPTAEADLETYYRTNYWTGAIEGRFDTTTFFSGHDEIADNSATIHDRYDDVHLIFFADHGSAMSFSGVMSSTHLDANDVYLMCPTVIDLACSTGQYDLLADASKPRLFVVQSIRRGAIVQISAVSVSYWHQMFDELLSHMYARRKSAGEAFRIAKNSEYDRDAFNFSTAYEGDPWYFLMGDPAFVPRNW